MGRRRRVPHRHRRARPQGPAGRRGARRHPARVGRPPTARCSAQAWDDLDITYDDYIRTTEPRHRAAVQEFLQRVYDAGDIELDSYEGLYCVGCELYYKEDELDDGHRCPIHGTPGRARHRGELLLPALALRGPSARSTTPSIPRRCSRRASATRCSASSSRACQDFSISRTSISWGIPLPWDDRHVAYVWFDALINYCTAVGYPDDRARFDRYWPVELPPHRQGHPPPARGVLARDAHGRGRGSRRRCVFAHGYLLVGGEKMSKTRLNQIAPADLVAEFGVDGFRYHFLVDQRFGPDGDFCYEAMVARYNADLANNFGNLANRVLNMAVNYCGGVVPDTRADGPLVQQAADAFAALTGAPRRARLRERLRRGVGSHPRHERLHRGPAAVGAQQGGRHRRGRGGARRLPGGAADRGAAGVADDPPGRGELWRRLGPARHARRTSACPRPPPGACSRPGRRWRRAHPCSPGSSPARPTNDPLGRQPLPPRDGSPRPGPTRRPRRGPARPGSSAWSAWAPTWRPRATRSSSPIATPTCGPPSASTRTTRRASPTEWGQLEMLAGTPSSSSRSARPASTSTTSTHRPDEQETAFRCADPPRAPARPRARDPHARRVGRHVPRARRRRACRARTVFHCFTGGPAEAERALDARRVPVVQRHRVVQERRRRARRRAPRRRSTALLVETDAPYLAPVPHRGQAERARVGRRRRARAGRGHGA